MAGYQKIVDFSTQYFLDYERSVHGYKHWNQVYENCLSIAARHDYALLRDEIKIFFFCFAMLHDVARENEYADPEHGPRAAALVAELDFLPVQADLRDVLLEAIEWHTNGIRHNNLLVQICWDADRLDIGRVGIVVDERYLQTKAAKEILRMRNWKISEKPR